MGNDVHYFTIFTLFFFLLAIISPLIEEEFKSDSKTKDHISSYNIGDADVTIDTIFGVPISILKIFGNMFTIPFWTFGMPLWINLYLLLPIRIIFIFLIARNIWVGGGS